MVIGTGIDIIEVTRISAAAQRSNFVERIFTKAEQAYFERMHFNPQTIAGTFAAKEATAKALAVGFSGVGWKDIEILRDENGKPYTVLTCGALARMNELGGKVVHISISHIKELAVSQAILED
ncbi:MAG: holo-ACP synthase [Clostridia bacterium]